MSSTHILIFSLGGLLNCAGAWVRWQAGNQSYGVALGGQMICSLAQTFLLSAPVKLATLWFKPDRRAILTSVGFAINQVKIRSQAHSSLGLHLT